MFRRILFLTLPAVLFLTGCATEQNHSKRTTGKNAAGSIRTVRTTAYTHTEPGGSHSASGTWLCDIKGKVKSAAADWSRYPLGTKFEIVKTGEVYEVCDYGSALVGKNTIDLYKGSRKAMRNWGVRYVEIKILHWGSPEKSLQVLKPRSRSKHVRMMLVDLRKQT